MSLHPSLLADLVTTTCEHKQAKGKRRRRCDTCSKLVCDACWYVRTRVCIPCYAPPETPEDHLLRIDERYVTMREAFDAYEDHCLEVWWGWSEGPWEEGRPSAWQAFDDWRAAIEEAASALGLPLTAPVEPFQTFPVPPVEGAPEEVEGFGVYDISALREMVRPTFKVTKGGKGG